MWFATGEDSFSHLYIFACRKIFAEQLSSNNKIFWLKIIIFEER